MQSGVEILGRLANFTRLAGRISRDSVKLVPILTFARVVRNLLTAVATFLPLKILVLIELGRTPRYFPAALQSLPLGTLIVAMLAMTVILFGSAALLFGLENLLVSAGGARLLASSQAWESFSKLRGVPRKNQAKFEAFVDIGSGILFYLAGLVAIAVFFPALAILQSSALVVILATQAPKSLSDGPNDGGGDSLDLRQYALAALVGGVVVISLLGYTPNFSVTLICLLLARQGINQVIRAHRLLGGLDGSTKSGEA